MDWNALQTYGEAPDRAFETLCNQLFRRYLIRSAGTGLKKFRVVNGAAGDGGVESYGELHTGEVVGVQSKWFRSRLEEVQFKQIRKSIDTALKLRPNIKKYIICVPRNLHSLKYGRGKEGEGKKPVEHHEDEGVDVFSDEMSILHPGLELEWWFDADIELELGEIENEGIRKFWFEKEVITHDYLVWQFSLQKASWLHDRYIPELHAQGEIKKIVDLLCFNKSFQERAMADIQRFGEAVGKARRAIEDLIRSRKYDGTMNKSLEEVSQYLHRIGNETVQIFQAVEAGQENYQVNAQGGMDVSGILDILSQWPKENSLKQLLPNAINALLSLRQDDPGGAVNRLQRAFGQSVRLVLGDGGTGKTHGLAKAVEDHLAAGAPALIVRAKGTPCSSWDEIFRSGLQLNGWSLHEVLVALEARAELCDRRRVAKLPEGVELKEGVMKVLVAIDGLEEDARNETQWNERIRESEVLAERYPRLRFLFSARGYFYDSGELPAKTHFKIIDLPREGDVSVQEVASSYFTHFGITGVGLNLIKGIRRLFGLRLFCNLYSGRKFKEGEEIVTAEYRLLNEKIDRVERAFAQLPGLSASIGAVRTPVGDALEMIADSLSGEVDKVEHSGLVDRLDNGGINYLPAGGIDQVIDHLVNHGFIVRLIEVEKRSGREVKRYYYTVSYEPIIELMMAARIVEEIRAGRMDRIPPHTKLPVVESVCQQFFEQDGRMIGEEGFLVKGFDGDSILMLQLGTLSKSPKGGHAGYAQFVKDQFLGSPKGRNLVLAQLILPASFSGNNVFGAEFLHAILSEQPSCFVRDKVWIGPDLFDSPGKNSHSVQALGLPAAFRHLEVSDYRLPSTALHNETPLIYAWALGALDQSFLEKIRHSLYLWALEMPAEYLLLLDRMFLVGDPQVQEGLASIMLGLAGKLKDRSALLSLATWALDNVFANVLTHRDVIVRQGCQAIVERAFQFGLIDEKQVARARPHQQEIIELLPLDEHAVLHQKEEIYPIVHDLAWYVINDAFEKFLAYPEQTGRERIDHDRPEARQLLTRYRLTYTTGDLYGRAWAMAAALAFIRGRMGFDRTTGNWSTQESHGGKSAIFTYEEKYTWLAVHFLAGYLSDYVPLTESGRFLQAYVQLFPVANPAETVSIYEERSAEWWIPQTLSEELNADNDVGEEIRQWIEKDPEINWTRWLQADGADFPEIEDRKDWLALYSWTALHDSTAAVYSYLLATACLIKKGGVAELLTLVKEDPDDLHSIDSADHLRCLPNVDSYSNPSDLVWMPWIGEIEWQERYFFDGQEKEIDFTVTKVMTNTMQREGELSIPSKKIRELLRVVEMDRQQFNDRDGTCVAFRNEVRDDGHDEQELVFASRQEIEKALDREGYEIFWIAELFKRKNMSNIHLEDIPHVSRGRKYLVWQEGGEYRAWQFWDDSHL